MCIQNGSNNVIGNIVLNSDGCLVGLKEQSFDHAFNQPFKLPDLTRLTSSLVACMHGILIQSLLATGPANIVVILLIVYEGHLISSTVLSTLQ